MGLLMNTKISISEFLLVLIGVIFILYISIASFLSTSKIVSLPSLFNLNTPGGAILFEITVWAYMLYVFYSMWKRYKRHKREFP